jgi:hypothetical protein
VSTSTNLAAIGANIRSLGRLFLSGPEVGFILSESVLRRNLGNPVMMRDQLLHLSKVAKLPNITIQVFPFDSQTFEPASYGFTILRFGEDSASEVIYVEDFTDAEYLDRPEVVRAYTRLWDRLRAAALGPVESRRFILHVADEIRRDKA